MFSQIESQTTNYMHLVWWCSVGAGQSSCSCDSCDCPCVPANTSNTTSSQTSGVQPGVETRAATRRGEPRRPAIYPQLLTLHPDT